METDEASASKAALAFADELSRCNRVAFAHTGEHEVFVKEALVVPPSRLAEESTGFLNRLESAVEA